MAQISAGIAGLEESSPRGPSSDCLSSHPTGKQSTKHCFLVAVASLLFVGIVSLSALAKDGLYYPQSSSAHRISKVSKMSQHQLPGLENERHGLVQAFPDTSRDVNEGVRLNDKQEAPLPRAAVVLASPPLRSPPRH